tara:strand:+ start:1182 stop:1439 length:258 start_codon:yes stop_codon:yes gene_type:complete
MVNINARQIQKPYILNVSILSQLNKNPIIDIRIIIPSKLFLGLILLMHHVKMYEIKSRKILTPIIPVSAANRKYKLKPGGKLLSF